MLWLKRIFIVLVVILGAALMMLKTDLGQSWLAADSILVAIITLAVVLMGIMVLIALFIELLWMSAFPVHCWQDRAALVCWYVASMAALFAAAIYSWWFFILVLFVIPVDDLRDRYMALCRKLYSSRIPEGA